MTAEKLTFTANLDLTQDVNGEDVVAEILHLIEQYINPSIQFSSLEELQEEGLSLDDIYDTPSCEHGFVTSAQLKSRQSDFYVSKIADYIVGLKGVRGLRDFKVIQDGVPIFGDIISVDEGKYLTLGLTGGNIDALESLNIRLFKGGVTHRYLDTSVIYSLGLREAHSKQGFETVKKRKLEGSDSISSEQLSSYLTIQSTFPSIYGVGSFTPHERDGKERLAQSRQLQGYLLFFDQIMANHLAQLRHIHRLFSVTDLDPKSYFSQLLDKNTPGVKLLLNDLNESDLSFIANELSDRDRKNRALSHLLARFGERFTTEFHLKFNQLLEGLPKKEVGSQLISLKAKFLKDVVNLNRYRSIGINYLEDHQTQEPTSLKKKICLLLNIEKSKNRKLAKSSIHKFLKKDKLDSTSLELKKGESEHYYDVGVKEGKIKFIINSKSIVEYLFRYGLNINNYKIISEEAKYILLFSPPKKDHQVKIGEFASKEITDKKLDKLIQFLKRLNNDCEGFHIVEHILFRPRNEDAHFFILKSYQNEILYKSLKENTTIAQQEMAQDSILLGCFISNYELLQNKNNKFVVFIKSGIGQHFAKSEKSFDSKKIAEKFIEYSLSLFKQAKTRNDISSCYEIENHKKCSFSILNDSMEKLLLSVEAAPLHIQEEKIVDIEVLGLTKSNYRTITFDDGTVKITLDNYDGSTLVESHKEIMSDERVSSFIDECIGICKKNQHNKLMKNSVLFSRADGREAKDYNSKISIVYPNWTSRFQSDEFLQIFGKTIFNCAPAHLGVDLVGLSFNRMKKFESLYFDYLSKMKNSANDELMYLGDQILSILSQDVALQTKNLTILK